MSLKNYFNLGNDDETIKLIKEIRTKNGFEPGKQMTPMLADIGITTVQFRKVGPISGLHQIVKYFGRSLKDSLEMLLIIMSKVHLRFSGMFRW
jgi:hypothetical protein